MKFSEFLESKLRQKTWSVTGQPYYSKIEQRPHRPIITLPYGQNLTREQFGELYYQSIIKKNQDKFKELFNYLKNKYMRIFYKKFDNLTIQTIEDAFQESIMKFLEQKFNERDNIEGYFRMIMNNKILDIFKSKQKVVDAATDTRDEKTISPIDLLISNELRLRISKIIEDVINNIDKKKVAAFCLGYGLGCYENGKVKIPEKFEFGPIYKLLKTGEFSDKLDYDYIIKELAKKRIKINKSQIAQAFLQIRSFMLEKLNFNEANLSFRQWTSTYF